MDRERGNVIDKICRNRVLAASTRLKVERVRWDGAILKDVKGQQVSEQKPVRKKGKSL